MEIVLADVVTEQFFDAETGKPIRTGAGTVGTPQPMSSGSRVWSGATTTVPLPGELVVGEGDIEEKSLDDFPIDMKGGE
jgi:hypothetical protein